MSVTIRPEQQIQRINELLNKLRSYEELTDDLLNQRPVEKSWSVLEVVKHLLIAQGAYRDRINKALSEKNGKQKKVELLRSSIIPGLLIKMFPPNEGKVRYKMKTMKQFQPKTPETGKWPRSLLSELEDCLKELKSWVDYYRTEQISLRKFNSAIGPLVRFNVPEACEFILGHHERHFFQMERALERTQV